MCAVATLLFGVSVPAAVIAEQTPAPGSVSDRIVIMPQAFAATGVAAVSPVSRDAFGVEQIPQAPVLVASAPAYSMVTGSLAMWPANGGVNDGFGYRDGGEFHKGIDIMAGYGAPIVAASPGVVVTVTEDGGWGQYVKIDHGGGISTLYAHMISGSAVVSVGQAVNAGDALGSVGDTGYVTVAHLHFEVYVGNSVVDPMGWLP